MINSELSRTKLFALLSLFVAAFSILAFDTAASLQISNSQIAKRTGRADYRGNDFWVAFPENARSEAGSVLSLSIIIVGDSGTNVQIQLPNSETPIALTLPNERFIRYGVDSLFEVQGGDRVSKSGIHVTSDHFVSIYAFDHRQKSTDSYAAIPTSALGWNYVVAGYDPIPMADSRFTTQCTIIATENGTMLDLTAPPDTGNNLAPPKHWKKQLNRGEVYQLQQNADELDRARQDLTGTMLTASKPVAFLTGHVCAQVPSDVSFCDMLLEQEPSIENFGTEHVAVNMITKEHYTLRVIATEDNTEVLFAGTHVANLRRGGYYTCDTLVHPTLITTSKPTLVAEYGRSAQADSVQSGDPFMMLLVPNANFIEGADVVLYTPEDGMIAPGGSFVSDAERTRVDDETIDSKINKILAARASQSKSTKRSKKSKQKSVAPMTVARMVEPVSDLELEKFESRNNYVVSADGKSYPVRLLDSISAHHELHFGIRSDASTDLAMVQNGWRHFLSVVIPIAAIPTLRVDGMQVKPLSQERVAGSTLMTLQLELPPGEHRVRAAAPIAIYAYGFGGGENGYDSYGHSCGQMLKTEPSK